MSAVHGLLHHCFHRGLGGWPYLWRSRQRRHEGKSSHFSLLFVTNLPPSLSSGPTFSWPFCLPTYIQYVSTFLLFLKSHASLGSSCALAFLSASRGVSIFCFGSLFPFPSLSCSFFCISVLSVAHCLTRLVSCCASSFSCLGGWTAPVLGEGCLWKSPNTP